jgi:hypothetical protein
MDERDKAYEVALLRQKPEQVRWASVAMDQNPKKKRKRKAVEALAGSY